MSDDAILAEAVRRIEAHCHPRAIVLFGSRARGDARPSSDFDLAVIVEAVASPWRLAAELYERVFDLGAAFDILVFEGRKWDEWCDEPLSPEGRIARDGKVLNAPVG